MNNDVFKKLFYAYNIDETDKKKYSAILSNVNLAPLGKQVKKNVSNGTITVSVPAMAYRYNGLDSNPYNTTLNFLIRHNNDNNNYNIESLFFNIDENFYSVHDLEYIEDINEDNNWSVDFQYDLYDRNSYFYAIYQGKTLDVTPQTFIDNNIKPNVSLSASFSQTYIYNIIDVCVRSLDKHKTFNGHDVYPSRTK